jgi:hypothetical protein
VISVGGKVRRATRGTVAILIDERRGAQWTAVAHLTATVAQSGRFGRRLDLPSALHYRVRAAYLGTPGYQPSLSGYHFIARAR